MDIGHLKDPTATTAEALTPLCRIAHATRTGNADVELRRDRENILRRAQADPAGWLRLIASYLEGIPALVDRIATNKGHATARLADVAAALDQMRAASFAPGSEAFRRASDRVPGLEHEADQLRRDIAALDGFVADLERCAPAREGFAIVAPAVVEMLATARRADAAEKLDLARKRVGEAVRLVAEAQRAVDDFGIVTRNAQRTAGEPVALPSLEIPAEWRALAMPSAPAVVGIARPTTDGANVPPAGPSEPAAVEVQP